MTALVQMRKEEKMTKKTSGSEDQVITPELLTILACPACEVRPPVELTPDKKFLRCIQCRRKYPINNGIPVMLVEEAVVDN